MLSSFQRIYNDMSLCESSSDHKVASENYYIIRIESLDESVDLTEFSKKDIIAKRIMGENVICAYVYYNTSYILYSSTNKKHYLEGSHHELCSHYASNATLFTGYRTRCNVIEFESRTKVLIYFQMKVFENMKDSVIYFSNVSLQKKEIDGLTHDELLKKLEDKASDKWDTIPSCQKFGTFYKFQILDDGTKKFCTLSELFDPKNMEKYSCYLFS